EADAADILVTILAAKAEALRQVCPHHVAIEDFHFGAKRAQPALQQARDRALAGPRKSGEPEREALMPVGRHARPFHPEKNGCRTLFAYSVPTTSVPRGYLRPA